MGGERRLANYKLPDALLAELAKVAKKQGTTQTRIVEDLLVEYLGAVCEECGR